MLSDAYLPARILVIKKYFIEIYWDIYCIICIETNGYIIWVYPQVHWIMQWILGDLIPNDIIPYYNSLL